MHLTLALLAALAFTVGGVVMKSADGVRHLLPVIGFVTLFGIGAALQSTAMRGAELGATYILVLGLEAAMAFVLGVVLFDESVTAAKLSALVLIVTGIVLLRLP
jgi:multidrug transporter EmrE-like cation transporter